MAAIRVGVIGAGAVARTLHLPLLRRLREVELHWIVDKDRAAAEQAAFAFGIPAALDDVDACPDADAVLIAIPVGARERSWAAAARRRWHVLCEKPAMRTGEEFDRLVRPMQEAGRVVEFGFMRRFYAGTRTLRDLVLSRVLGDPIEVWAAEGSEQTRTGREAGWYQLDSRLAGGGVLIETGSHLLDQVLFCTGASELNIDGYEQRAWKEGPEFDARATGTLSLGSSFPVPFSCLVSRSEDLCNGIHIRYPRAVLSLSPGPAGAVELKDAEGGLLARFEGAADAARTSHRAFHDEWAAFLARCRSGSRARALDDNLAVRASVAAIESCYAAARALPRP